MKSLAVSVPTIKVPIQESPGFDKKDLADYKLDLIGLCEFGCSYCSSNHGNYLRMNRAPFANLTEQQLGVRVLPAEEPRLTFRWPEIIEHLEQQLTSHPKTWGHGHTLVFSMLTDGFSPQLVKDGTTRQALEMVLEHTSFRIRVLTKNAIVGSPQWVKFFCDHVDRFVVGLSIGTRDDDWAKRVERFTSAPSARVAALRKLQDAGVPTYGMLCPVFPHVLQKSQLEDLVDGVRPDLVEHIWAEPYNDRQNWPHVRRSLSPADLEYTWLTHVYEERKSDLWSRYATDLYLRLLRKGRRAGWVDKLRYLLYETEITEGDAPSFAGFHGVMLQAKPGDDGRSRNPFIAALQTHEA